MKRCIVIGGSDIDIRVKDYIKDGDFVICADKGWVYADKEGIKPDLIVGDFDSSEKPANPDCPVTVLPVEKDDTDTHYIAKYLVENEFTDVLMTGVLGGKRVEHTMAAFQTLLYLARNRVNATAIDRYSTVTAIIDGGITLPAMDNKFFSIFCMSGAAFGVDITGAKYELSKASLTNFYPVGVSNEFTGKPVSISVADGDLLIIITEKD